MEMTALLLTVTELVQLYNYEKNSPMTFLFILTFRQFSHHAEAFSLLLLPQSVH